VRVSPPPIETPRTTRRAFSLGVASLGVAARARAQPADAFSEFSLEVPDAPARLTRATVLLPRERRADLSVLILLHGLGETTGPRLGLRAWVDRYGLGHAWNRLSRAPLVNEDARYLSEETLAELNASLKPEPFRGLCVVCPFLPNPYATPSWSYALDRYAHYVVERLLPALATRLPELTTRSSGRAIAGVSLGGYAALEVFSRRRESFGGVGTLQGAFSQKLADSLVARMSPQGASVYVATSTLDPYRAANQRLASELARRNALVSLSVRPGPHSQDWLREVGTLEALRWADRTLP
jgi:hypothetical protein